MINNIFELSIQSNDYESSRKFIYGLPISLTNYIIDADVLQSKFRKMKITTYHCTCKCEDDKMLKPLKKNGVTNAFKVRLYNGDNTIAIKYTSCGGLLEFLSKIGNLFENDDITHIWIYPKKLAEVL